LAITNPSCSAVFLR